MKNKPSVDIVIAAYNSHNTIVRTLSSIAIQKIDFNINVIVVNDGSTHGFKKEIDLFKDDLNIKEVTLKKNSGPGVSKQKGLESGKSEYIVFLDSDDVFSDAFALQSLYKKATIENSDYTYGALIFEDNGRRNLLKTHDGCLHGKMYKRKIIEENNIKFNTTRTSEDNSFNHIYLFNSKSISGVDSVVYVYKDNGKSLTKGITISKKADNLIDYINNIIYTMNNVKNKYQDRVEEYYKYCFSYAKNEYEAINKISPKDGKRILVVLNKLEKEKYY